MVWAQTLSQRVPTLHMHGKCSLYEWPHGGCHHIEQMYCNFDALDQQIDFDLGPVLLNNREVWMHSQVGFDDRDPVVPSDDVPPCSRLIPVPTNAVAFASAIQISHCLYVSKRSKHIALAHECGEHRNAYSSSEHGIATPRYAFHSSVAHCVLFRFWRHYMESAWS